MKKILVLVLMVMVLCPVCNAFKEPDPDRWVLFGTDNANTIKYWLDTKTLRFEKKYGETYANFWAMVHTTGEGTYCLDNMEININKREFKILSTTIYNDDGNVKETTSIPTRSVGITPGSVIETAYEIVCSAYLDKGKSAGSP